MSNEICEACGEWGRREELPHEPKRSDFWGLYPHDENDPNDLEEVEEAGFWLDVGFNAAIAFFDEHAERSNYYEMGDLAYAVWYGIAQNFVKYGALDTMVREIAHVRLWSYVRYMTDECVCERLGPFSEEGE